MSPALYGLAAFVAAGLLTCGAALAFQMSPAAGAALLASLTGFVLFVVALRRFSDPQDDVADTFE